jgi:Right handed beta helix region
MLTPKRLFLALIALALALTAGAVTKRGAAAQDGISGVIQTTLTITADSKLTGDVQCVQTSGPCINFGRPGITLNLNGFKITGTANVTPTANCVTAAEFPANEADGIHSKFDDVVIAGPGLVQQMKRHGIALIGTASDPVERAVVRNVVSHQNCFSGVFMGSVNNSLVEDVVSARNSANGEARPCGGVCVTNSSDNRVRRTETYGNGTTALGPPPSAIPNDFGIGLVGSSNGNIIEESRMGGNINGLALFPLSPAATPTRNVIRRNVIVGNPPMEVSAANHPRIELVGADIRDFSPAGSNRFEGNLCVTYTGSASPAPCPNVSDFSGQRGRGR